MPAKHPATPFCSELFVAKGGAFCFARVPPELSASHLRRGRMTATVGIGDSRVDALMEPDGALGHWFVVPPGVMAREGLMARQRATFVLDTLERQPEPVLPEAFATRLEASPAARATWDGTSTLARIDWVHWMASAKLVATREERCAKAIDMLEQGKKRVCCFDPSGVFSKGLTCPVED